MGKCWGTSQLKPLYNSRLPSKKDVQPPLLCIKMASHARKLLQRILHLSSRCPWVSSKCQDRVLPSAEPVQKLLNIYSKWVQVHSELKIFWTTAWCQEGKPLLFKKNIKDRLKCCRMCKDWTAEDWCKVILSDEAPFWLFGTSGKCSVWRWKGERLESVLCRANSEASWDHPCVGLLFIQGWLSQFFPKTLP